MTCSILTPKFNPSEGDSLEYGTLATGVNASYTGGIEESGKGRKRPSTTVSRRLACRKCLVECQLAQGQTRGRGKNTQVHEEFQKEWFLAMRDLYLKRWPKRAEESPEEDWTMMTSLINGLKNWLRSLVTNVQATLIHGFIQRLKREIYFHSRDCEECQDVRSPDVSIGRNPSNSPLAAPKYVEDKKWGTLGDHFEEVEKIIGMLSDKTTSAVM